MKDYTPRIQTAEMRPGGAYDIVGDVHGCWSELSELMGLAGWQIDAFDPAAAAPFSARHPEGRLFVFAGDLTDRGPASNLTLRLALGMMAEGTAAWTIGNHDWKLARALRGNPVRIGGGLDATLRQIAPLGEGFAAAVRDAIFTLPYQLRLPMPANHPRAGDGVMTVVHAAAPDHHLDGGERNSFERSIYGYANGAREDGSLIRKDWAADYTAKRWVIHGHEPFAAARTLNRVIAIDTGCVFGNRLSLYRADTTDVLSVAARANHSGKDRDFY